MGKKDVDALYQEAIYWHLISEGYTTYAAEVESKRRIARKNDI